MAIALLAAVYVCDYLVLRYRAANHGNAFGTVNIRPYYAVPKKNGQTEFLFDDPQTEQCVHSLFPHLGDRPCWYAGRHTEKRIDI